MITAFPNQFTAMVIEVAQQLAPLHHLHSLLLTGGNLEPGLDPPLDN